MVCASIAQVVPAGLGEARCDFLPLLFQRIALAGRVTMEKAHFIGPLSRKKARRSSGLKLLILSLSNCEIGYSIFPKQIEPIYMCPRRTKRSIYQEIVEEELTEPQKKVSGTVRKIDDDFPIMDDPSRPSPSTAGDCF